VALREALGLWRGPVLAGLGVPPHRVPTDQDEAAAMYRSLLADRRVLVVLDNAGSPDQVRPLLPGNRECLLLVTSRDQLGGLVALDGARRLTLDVLGGDEAVDLLARLVGVRRPAADPEAAAAVARECAYLPLALRIAAARASDGTDLADLAAALAAARSVGPAAAGTDTALYAAFDLAYGALPEPARRMFRLLGLVPGPDAAVETAAALAGVTVAGGSRLLALLAAARLVDEQPPGRFTVHDRLRRYAAELAAAEGGDAVRAGSRRALSGV
jgi:hypothetical protein